MAIEKDTLDQLLLGRDPKEIFSREGLVDKLTKVLSERILNAEIDEHLDGERSDGKANRRNGTSKKTVLTGSSQVTIAVPRDRAGTFDRKRIMRFDLSDEEWMAREPLMPEARKSVRQNDRRIMNAILYVLHTGVSQNAWLSKRFALPIYLIAI